MEIDNIAFFLSYNPKYSVLLPRIKGEGRDMILIAPNFSNMMDKTLRNKPEENGREVQSRQKIENAYNKLCGRNLLVPQLAKMLGRDKKEREAITSKLTRLQIKAIVNYNKHFI